MNDINPIYNNGFGIAFQWKRGSIRDIRKVQMVFRDTGLLLSKEELVRFSKCIQHTKEDNGLCGHCTKDENCRALLLDTPAPQVTLAMSYKELAELEDLVEGTIFQMNLDSYLNGIFNS